eukprot:TRINITY_DN9245_c0_g1_i6.p1 TRINITY_DN9245_c0_g1~~TRINITY_DN9245_c0_g1_i6.p1  ORF type:complete len:938 (-),score=81.41 TRINITY_DN9245_c0_g1_i6:205-3018(-)
MVLLRQTLRSLCSPDGWTYAVFWKLKRRSRMVLTWEDGYCSAGTGNSFLSKKANFVDGNLLGMAVAKMSYHVYSFGEGVVGRVAFSGKHQWIFAPRLGDQRNGATALKGFAVDKYPSGWDDQFASGIKTIAVIAVPEGVLQLGSSSSMPEDLKFVGHVRSVFTALQTVPGAYLSDLFPGSTPNAKPAFTDTAGSGLPADIAAVLGDGFGDFHGGSLTGSMNVSGPRAVPFIPSTNSTPSLNATSAPHPPLPVGQSGSSLPPDLFELLGLGPDGQSPLQPPTAALPSQEDLLKQTSDAQAQAKRARITQDRRTKASIPISQIQLDFFDSDGLIPGLPAAPVRPNPSPGQPSARTQPQEASAHVLSPSGELIGSRPKLGGGVDLEQELRNFEEKFMDDPASLALLGAPPASASAMNSGAYARLASHLARPAAAKSGAPSSGVLPPGMRDVDALLFAAGPASPDLLPGLRADRSPPNPAVAKAAPGAKFGEVDELAQALGFHFTGQMPGVGGVGPRNAMSMTAQLTSGQQRMTGGKPSLSSMRPLPAVNQPLAGNFMGGFADIPKATPAVAGRLEALLARTGGSAAAGIGGSCGELAGMSRGAGMGAVTGGGRVDNSLADLERMATMEALMRTSGLLPPLSLAELKQQPQATAPLGGGGGGAQMVAAAAAAAPLASLQGDGKSVNVLRGGSGMVAKAAEAARATLKPARVLDEGVKEKVGQDMGLSGLAAKDDKKAGKKRGREEKPKQRPRDRQLIQDRVKDLRGIVPNSERLSIDGLLERTIQHLVFLRQFSSLVSTIEQGQAELAKQELEDTLFDQYPVSVHHLTPTLLQIKAEWVGDSVPMDLSDSLRLIGLTVRKSSVKASGGQVRADIVAEAKEGVDRMEVMWLVLQHLKEKLPLEGIMAGDVVKDEAPGNSDVADVNASDAQDQVLLPMGIISA